MKAEPLLRVAAALIFLAVALGAFGAHALKARLENSGFAATWQTAVFYHLTHALALLVFGALQQRGADLRGPVWLVLAGIVLFSGSLYLLALTGVRWLGAITPLGGLCFLAAWAWVVVQGFGKAAAG